MPYKIEITTNDNKKLKQELEDMRELINFLKLNECYNTKRIKVHKIKTKRIKEEK